jgi:thermostable 8-oxoguanine DNA glycosylase
MEIHKSIKIENKYNISLKDDYKTYFEKGFKFVNDNYKEDFDRIKNTRFEEITPTFFFKEYIWVVCVSGFNSKIISKMFPDLLKAYQPLFGRINGVNETFLDEEVRAAASKIFNNKRKIDAIIKTSHIIKDGINKFGWEIYKNNELSSREKVQQLPFIGKIISSHLLRNCGKLDFVKWDKHLVRLSNHWDFENPDKLCFEIQKDFNLPLGLIDLVLFYSAATFGSK